jgi:signal transduction histidine kinase
MPRLGEFISQNTEAILAEWESFARGLSSGDTMDIVALRDHAKEMLQVMATDVSQPQTTEAQSDKAQGRSDADARRAVTAAQEHGAGRAESGFTVEEMVAEFRALRASVIHLWSREQGQANATDLQDMIRFNEAIDQAIAESIAVYARDVKESKDRFLAILGHDLQTPLGAIITSTRFMLDTGVAEPHRALVTGVERSARRMNRMVSDLLEFTRTRFGDSMPINPDDMDLGPVLRDVAAEVLASNPGLNIRVDTSGDLNGRWDRERLTQALTNLVGNAAYHGDKSRPIDIRGARSDAEVVLSIHNEGPPIPEDEIPELFKPMKENAGGVSRDRRHLGLGLYIVERVANAHKGSVAVTSSRESGTTFTMRLPAATD